jgi:hypothetical protein
MRGAGRQSKFNPNGAILSDPIEFRWGLPPHRLPQPFRLPPAKTKIRIAQLGYDFYHAFRLYPAFFGPDASGRPTTLARDTRAVCASGPGVFCLTAIKVYW